MVVRIYMINSCFFATLTRGKNAISFRESIRLNYRARMNFDRVWKIAFFYVKLQDIIILIHFFSRETLIVFIIFVRLITRIKLRSSQKYKALIWSLSGRMQGWILGIWGPRFCDAGEAPLIIRRSWVMLCGIAIAGYLSEAISGGSKAPELPTL